MIILRLVLTPQGWRVVLVCPHSISVSVIINYTKMAATRFLVNLDIVIKKKLVLYLPLLRKWINLGVQLERGGRFPLSFLKIDKKYPNFGKYYPACVHLWDKFSGFFAFFSIRVFFTDTEYCGEKQEIFSLGSSSFVCRA